MKSESEEWSYPKNDINSPYIDDVSSGESAGANGPLKKGPWTSAEDAILVDYVTKHGEGNWNAVQKHSGLARCGKSCRLRWANHLRPDLKKGAFSPEEERQIIELHAKIGNKWSRMAAELPGRTDNEIKNYWNTRIKRRQRAGLPIYPPDVCLQALNENQLKQNEQMVSFSSDDIHLPDFFPVNDIEFPALQFKAMELDQLLYPPELLNIPADTLLDVPASSLLLQGLNSSYSDNFLLSTIYPSKRFRGSDVLFPRLNAAVGNTLPEVNYQGNDSVQISESVGFSSVYDPYSTIDDTSSSSALSGSRAIINGNTSSSEPTWAMKLELPSLQNHFHMGSWDSSSSPLTPLESVDTWIQTPLEHAPSCSLSPQNSGLLDAVLYESQSMKKSKNSFHQTSQKSVMPVNMMDLHKIEWEPFADPFTPLCHSSSSLFSGSTCDELQSLETTVSVKEEARDDLFLLNYDGTTETTNPMIFSRPDFVLASNFFVSKKNHTKDNYLLKHTIGTNDYLSNDCKQMDTAAASSQGHHSMKEHMKDNYLFKHTIVIDDLCNNCEQKNTAAASSEGQSKKNLMKDDYFV